MSKVYPCFNCDECNTKFIKLIHLIEVDIDMEEQLDKLIEDYIINKQNLINKCSICIVNQYIKSNYGCNHHTTNICMMCKSWD
jgi:hypothetical protein